MAQYKYTALSADGAKVSGVINGYNEMDAASRIKDTCRVILKITEVKEKDDIGLLNMSIGSALNAKAFTVMCSQFAIILKSGIPIARTCHLIADKTTDKTLKRILNKVAQDVEAGRSLSAAFEDHGKKVLPVTFYETLKAGEASGSLDRSFQTMYEHFDKQTKMKAKVRGALAYPTFVMVIAVAVIIVLMTFVVPRFTVMFEDYDTELPLMTQILIGISSFFQKYILVIVAVLAALVLGVKLYGNTEKGRDNLARLNLKLPVLGNIHELTAASEFSNTMAAMLGSGLPVNKAISITSKVISNYHISTETGKLVEELEGGHTLSGSMRENQVLPDILVDMTGVGEETGELEETLKTIALYYDAELDEATKSALAKLEPALLIGLAVVAGFIVLSIYMAVFQLYGAM